MPTLLSFLTLSFLVILFIYVPMTRHFVYIGLMFIVATLIQHIILLLLEKLGVINRFTWMKFFDKKVVIFVNVIFLYLMVIGIYVSI